MLLYFIWQCFFSHVTKHATRNLTYLFWLLSYPPGRPLPTHHPYNIFVYLLFVLKYFKAFVNVLKCIKKHKCCQQFVLKIMPPSRLDQKWAWLTEAEINERLGLGGYQGSPEIGCFLYRCFLRDFRFKHPSAHQGRIADRLCAIRSWCADACLKRKSGLCHLYKNASIVLRGANWRRRRRRQKILRFRPYSLLERLEAVCQRQLCAKSCICSVSLILQVAHLLFF